MLLSTYINDFQDRDIVDLSKIQAMIFLVPVLLFFSGYTRVVLGTIPCLFFTVSSLLFAVLYSISTIFFAKFGFTDSDIPLVTS